MLKKLLNKSELLKNTLTLISGTAVAQLIPIALQPFLRRIYTPEDFGVLAIYSSVFSIIVVVAAGKYETTVVLPKEDEEANHLALGAILFSFVFNSLLLITFLLSGNYIINYFDFPPEMNTWIYFVPLSIFLISSYRALNNWLIRKKEFKKSSVNKVVRRLAEGTIQLGLGLTTIGKGLIIGTIIGDLSNFLIGLKQSQKTELRLTFNLKNIKKILKKYNNFPIYSALPSLLNTIGLFLPIIIINKFYSQEITGYVDLSRQMLALPIALISITISQVLLQKIAENRNYNQFVLPLIVKTSLSLSIISVLGIIIIILFGNPLFEFAFGSEWGYSGEISKILVFAYAIKFIVSPLSSVFISLEKIKMSSIWQFFYFVIICMLFFLNNYSLEKFLRIYVLMDLLAYTIYYTLILFVAKQHDNQLLNSAQ
ncbi:MAG: oligosaccharide flippase family protein [Vicingus serpentipes]|nr:oligosaccharide flippase family protein [Vicingus serpentipes]